MLSDDPDIPPSRLGTKEHWDQVYQTEIDNFEEFGDEGEIWFGKDSLKKMVNWAIENVPPASKPYCLDLGTGNGALCVALAERGYPQSRIAGIDYSEESVRLAQAIASSAERSSPLSEIVFQTCDFLSKEPAALDSMTGTDSSGQWDLLLDKGTLDAISLAEKDSEAGTAPLDKYAPQIHKLLKPACNFTEDELKARFETPDLGLIYHSRVQHQTMTFGGKSGSAYATLAFVKRAAE